MSTILGKPITMGGGGKLPDIFGDGSDGDLVIKAGETVTLEVPVPHQSVVEKQYKSITIEAGGTLTTADYNAGLVLRCQGNCTVHGTIDQSGKAPKTNPDSTYPYPEELVCGDGGKGGWAQGFKGQATAMAARPYGGGYGSGGRGGTRQTSSDSQISGGVGGSTENITIDTEAVFVGGSVNSGAGTNGGGGGGYPGVGGVGGNGPGGDGADSVGIGTSSSWGSGGGGAGNTGGGVLLLYVGGDVSMDGNILCNGLDGGSGGRGITTERVNYWAVGGAGGGGGGGGAIYIVHFGTFTNTGNLNVNGGAGGSQGVSQGYQTGGIRENTTMSTAGEAGAIGTTTIKQYEKGMTA